MHLELPVTLRNNNIALTLQSLLHVLCKAWLVAWPLAFPGGLLVIKCWRRHAHPTDTGPDPPGLVARIRIWFTRMVRQYIRPRAYYTTYPTATEEDEYWRAAGLARRAYEASDANADTPSTRRIPLVRYYAPKLPPVYRERAEADPEATEYRLSPRAFCKWHRMVFRGPLHPTLKEAAQQIRYYSSRDRQEIYTISRLLSDEDVFCKRVRRATHYAAMWKKWLGTKGPDVAIVFEQ